MSDEIKALDALEQSMAPALARLGWKRVISDGDPGFDLGIAAPFEAVFVASQGEWILHLTTARGVRNSVLGPIDSSAGVVLDALSFAIFSKANSELDYRDRSASAEMARVLSLLAIETGDTRYGGRAASLLAQHALKDGLPSRAQADFEEAVRLFTSAGDMTAADAARAQLDGLREFTT